MLLATLLGSLAKFLKQPRVLGGLIAGLLIGIVFTQTHLMHELRSEHGIPLITGLAEIAAMLLLFKVGLEANLHSLLEDAKTGWKVAVVGVVVPIIGGFVFAYFAKGLSWPVAVFLGGVLSATSVGITAAVLGELGVIDEEFSRIIINAAVIDDVLALFALTLCTNLNATEAIPMSQLALKLGGSVLFVIVVPLLGHRYAGKIVGLLSKMDEKAREAIVLSAMILYGAAALKVGLAGIVGAYFAGVALEEIYFKPKRENESSHPVEHFVDDLITGFGPVFFVYAGAIVNPAVFLNTEVFIDGMILTAIAMAGKLACGLMVKKDRLLVGVGMSPRGEVGIIFATIGLTSGILSQEMFGACMIMVLITTMATPPLLSTLAARRTGRRKLRRAAATG